MPEKTGASVNRREHVSTVETKAAEYGIPPEVISQNNPRKYSSSKHGVKQVTAGYNVSYKHQPFPVFVNRPKLAVISGGVFHCTWSESGCHQ